MKNFSLKFIDIMVGVILGLGFQWWPNLSQPWQYLAFVFVYLDVIDFWIDYSPSLKKFPPRRELDLILDVAIMFLLFLYIYATQLTIVYFLVVFAVFRALDFLWLLRARYQYQPSHADKTFVDTWIRFDVVEALAAFVLAAAALWLSTSSMIILIVFIIFRVTIRVLASLAYKRVHFA